MNLDRFWTLLDRLPEGEASAYEWQVEAGKEAWPAVRQFLRQTGETALRIPCPSHSGEACPRYVGQAEGGKWKASCAEPAMNCGTLLLDLADVLVHEFDIVSLGNQVNSALSLHPCKAKVRPKHLHHCGDYRVGAGQGVAVILLVMGTTDSSRLGALQKASRIATPALILTPTEFTLSEDERQFLEQAGAQVRTLAEFVKSNEEEHLTATPVALQTLRNLCGQTGQKQPIACAAPRIPFAPDTKWSEISLDFTGKTELHVRYKGQTYRFDPEQMGMKQKNSSKPTRQWTLLKLFGALKGTVSLPGPNQMNVYGQSGLDLDRIKKQKQILSGNLKDVFPIKGEPISHVGGKYVTEFSVSYTALKQGVQGQGEISLDDLKRI